MDPEKRRACNGLIPVPCQQIGWLAFSHGAFPKLIPTVALETAASNDAIPNFGINFVDAVECLNF